MRSLKYWIWVPLFFLTEYAFAQKGRPQWSEKEAWEWQERIGVIKGFNEPIEAYPGMSRKELFHKAALLGFNSVRFWIHATSPNEQVEYIRKMAEDADAYGLKISPVLAVQYQFFPRKDKQNAWEEAKKYTQQVVGAFANDSRIVLWDIWNEPSFQDTPEMYEQMDWIEAMVGWCREMSPIQPITSSIFWDTDVMNVDTVSRAILRRNDVEAMMDVHNFHHYGVATEHMKAIEAMINRLRKISNRPLVCTEAIARTTGATVPRSLISFAEYNVHFFTWGLYMCDMNWTVTWGKSSYEPFSPMFHELLHPDGEPYDYRELEWLRNFHFAKKGEAVDPGIEYTDRWSKDRAWRWMISGPVKGLSYSGKENSGIVPKNTPYNGLRIKCDFDKWKQDAPSFYKNMERQLTVADRSGMRVIPALLTDDYLHESDTVLAEYVAQVIKHYATDPRVLAWEIYTHPGKKETNTERLTQLVKLLFRFARFEFPNQPLTATPWIQTKDFPADFKYKEALIHGRLNGWNYLECKGGSTPELCNLIWKLSDIVSFSSSQKAAETGWLTSIAYRYGRPLFCTEWWPPSKQEEQTTLDIFAKQHVFWYCAHELKNREAVNNFRFKPISTLIQ